MIYHRYSIIYGYVAGATKREESRKMQEILQYTSKCKKSCISILCRLAYANCSRPRSRSPTAPPAALRGPIRPPAPGGGYAVGPCCQSPGKARKSPENRQYPRRPRLTISISCYVMHSIGPRYVTPGGYTPDTGRGYFYGGGVP